VQLAERSTRRRARLRGRLRREPDASWPADAAESYLYFDPTSQTLGTRREAMHVSWFATAGAIDVDATAVGEDDPTLAAMTTWHAPPSPGAAWLWLVLRDSRGGIATQTIAVTLR
jgi:hypothetical protein